MDRLSAMTTRDAFARLPSVLTTTTVSRSSHPMMNRKLSQFLFPSLVSALVILSQHLHPVQSLLPILMRTKMSLSKNRDLRRKMLKKNLKRNKLKKSRKKLRKSPRKKLRKSPRKKLRKRRNKKNNRRS